MTGREFRDSERGGDFGGAGDVRPACGDEGRLLRGPVGDWCVGW